MTTTRMSSKVPMHSAEHSRQLDLAASSAFDPFVMLLTGASDVAQRDYTG